MISFLSVKWLQSLYQILVISGNALTPNGDPYDQKEGQWFGAVVESSGEDGIILVSLFKYSKQNPIRQERLFFS